MSEEKTSSEETLSTEPHEASEALAASEEKTEPVLEEESAKEEAVEESVAEEKPVEAPQAVEVSEEQPAEEEPADEAQKEAVEASENKKEETAAKAQDVFSKIRTFVTAERIMGLIALLLIPCFFASWVHLPITEKVGIEVNLSMPETLSAGQTAINQFESMGEIINEVKAAVDKSVEYIGKAVEVTAKISQVLNSDTGDYKEAISEALATIIEDNVQNDTVASVAEKASSAVVDKGVDKAASELEGTEVQKNLEKAGDAAATVSDTTKEIQDKAEDVQDTVNEAKAAYDSGLQAAKTALGVATFVWYAFMLLLLIAAVLLFVGIRGRYVTAIVAFSISTVFSFGVIIGVSVANQAILDALASVLGAWITAFIPSIIAITAWPWVVAVASILGIVITAILLSNHRKALAKAEA